MAEFDLLVKERQIGAQSQLTQIREEKKVPGVVYGYSNEPLSIEVTYGDLLRVLTEAGTSNIINLKIGDKSIKVIVREFQQDPVSDKLTHVDFMLIDDKREITTVVPLEFVGVSPAIREKGGKLNVKNDIVNVRCLPQNLPASVKVDISKITDIGQKIVIGDLEAGEGVLILDDANAPVATVVIPKKLKIIEPTPVETAVEGEEGEEAAEGEAKEAGKGEDKKNEGEAKEGDKEKKE